MLRLHRRYGTEMTLLPPGEPNRASLSQALAALRQRELSTGQALRILRQITIERLARMDCEEGAALEVITRCMTDLAEFSLDIAVRETLAELDADHGPPLGAQGRRCELLVIGMGKLGARELNVSSDIDIIYVYDEEGETTGDTQGRGKISCHEYFAKTVKKVQTLIGDSTEHGFVFRVDLALRPNGNSGPAAISLAALEEYFQVQGREWERFAWLKSRIVAPASAMGGPPAAQLRAMVLPFVFRRYLDYNVFESLRVLHRQIREHAARRSMGHPERANDVKLSRGGIREIEFTVQLLQVVRGGQFPELRTRPTLGALERIARAGLMPADTAVALTEAYVFLRRVEHRIQYLDDQQTHMLPTADSDLDWVARTLAYPDSRAFLADLDRHREVVAQEFDKLLGGQGQQDCKGPGCGRALGESGATPLDLQELLPGLPERFRERVQAWQTHPRIQAARDATRTRLLRLIQRTSVWLQEGRVNEDAAIRLADWMESLLRRESYLALLLERPRVHERLLHLLGAARWPARYLLRHPGVIDELANDTMISERFDAVDFVAELEHRRAALASSGEDDDESLLNMLRRAHHAEVFRTLARDVEGRISVEQVADDLSALADAVLGVTADWCWSRLRSRHRERPQVAVIAYGKLGGKELGYGSDLDIVFVYEDDDERAPEVYAAFVRKLISWLTLKTGEGDLFEIDTALRPNGNSGLLVTTFEAFQAYQEQRGTNTAWTWEHQAMTRARFVLGSDSMRERFDRVRGRVISAPRDPLALRDEIVGMRERLRSARPVPPGRFDVKHSPGGMLDIEFAVQYLVLSCSGQHPQLIDNVGNIALLQRAQACGLLPEGLGDACASAYRELRQVQHRSRLNEEPTQVDASAMPVERAAALRLWSLVAGT